MQYFWRHGVAREFQLSSRMHLVINQSSFFAVIKHLSQHKESTAACASMSGVSVWDDKTKHVVVVGKEADPAIAKFLDRAVLQPMPPTLKQARNQIATLPVPSQVPSRAHLKSDANAWIEHYTNAVRLAGDTPDIDMCLAAAWLDKGDYEMALASVNSAIRKMKRLDHLIDPQDVSLQTVAT